MFTGSAGSASGAHQGDTTRSELGLRQQQINLQAQSLSQQAQQDERQGVLAERRLEQEQEGLGLRKLEMQANREDAAFNQKRALKGDLRQEKIDTWQMERDKQRLERESKRDAFDIKRANKLDSWEQARLNQEAQEREQRMKFTSLQYDQVKQERDEYNARRDREKKFAQTAAAILVRSMHESPNGVADEAAMKRARELSPEVFGDLVQAAQKDGEAYYGFKKQGSDQMVVEPIPFSLQYRVLKESYDPNDVEAMMKPYEDRLRREGLIKEDTAKTENDIKMERARYDYMQELEDKKLGGRNLSNYAKVRIKSYQTKIDNLSDSMIQYEEEMNDPNLSEKKRKEAAENYKKTEKRIFDLDAAQKKVLEYGSNGGGASAKSGSDGVPQSAGAQIPSYESGKKYKKGDRVRAKGPNGVVGVFEFDGSGNFNLVK